jgi:hypothetical protein
MPALLWARLYKSAGVAGVSQHEAGSEDQGAARCQSEPGRCPSGKTERHAREHVPASPNPSATGRRRVAGGDEKTVRPCLRPLYDGPDEERREWLLWALILIRGGYKPEGAASICDLQKRPAHEAGSQPVPHQPVSRRVSVRLPEQPLPIHTAAGSVLRDKSAAVPVTSASATRTKRSIHRTPCFGCLRALSLPGRRRSRRPRLRRGGSARP